MTWTATGLAASGEAWASPGDLKAVVQEVVDRPDRPVDFHLNLIIDQRSTASYAVRSWDAGDHSLACKIAVTYSVDVPAALRGPGAMSGLSGLSGLSGM